MDQIEILIVVVPLSIDLTLDYIQDKKIKKGPSSPAIVSFA